MKYFVLSALLAVAAGNLLYTSDEQSSLEEGVAEGPRATNCSCGWTNKKRIVGGRETLKNEYPLMAAMLHKASGTPFCGASIITTNHALTASHCTVPMKGQALQLLAGAHDITNKNDPEIQVVDIAYSVEHESYDAGTVQHDIALLILATPLKFTQNIGPACLPTEKFSLENEWVKVMGWGKLVNKGKVSQVLQKVNLKVFPIETCVANYQKPIATDNPTQICTYRNKKDSCQGDSGGPLVWLDPETNRYTQVALVSYGKACASRAPAVNTDVAHYVPWIQSTIAASGLRGQTCSK